MIADAELDRLDALAKARTVTTRQLLDLAKAMPALIAEVRRLREALAPFATMLDPEDMPADTGIVCVATWPDGGTCEWAFPVSLIYRARGLAHPDRQRGPA